jgi:ATP-dependent helicase/nuclease subunit B
MASSALIITSPRAADRIDAALQWLDRVAHNGRALVIAANPDAADDLLRSFGTARGALFGIERLTLGRLVAVLAAEPMASAGLAPAAGLALEAVAARTVFRLRGVSELGWFAPVLDLPGFPGALARTLTELRLNAVGAAELRGIEGPGAALMLLLEQFARELRNSGLADRAGMIELAVGALSLPGCQFAGLPTLLLDTPLETLRERELLATLVRRASEVLATIPAGDTRTMGLMRDALGLDRHAEADAVHRDDAGPDSLRLLQTCLFAESTPSYRPLDDSVTLLSAPGEMQECVEIARRIQAEAGRGLRFDRIAVLLHDPVRYAPYLEEALERAAIPAYFVNGTARPEVGGRALLALLACAAENLSARKFAQFLSLGTLPDPASSTPETSAKPGSRETFIPPHDELIALVGPDEKEIPSESAEDDPLPVVEIGARAPWRWERILVDAAVIGGRERWRKRLQGLEAEIKLKRDALEDDDARAKFLDRQAADLAHVREIALPIIDALSDLPIAASWAEWLVHLRALTEIAVRDNAAVLAALAEIDPMGPVGPVTLDEVRVVLDERLGRLERRSKETRYGSVFVAPAAYARGLEFDVTIIPGLAERIFPRKLTEDPILPDAMRRAAGFGLKLQTDRVAAERLALRIAIGAARKATVLSYPRVDLEQGRPRVPSFYALEVLRAAEGRLPGFDELASRSSDGHVARLGWPAPKSPADAIDEAEFDLAVLDKLLDANPETTIGAAHYLLDANPHLGRALRARARRWRRLWTPNDGLVDVSEEEGVALARHQLNARSYSPTALQNFAACPYRFFLQAIHRLEPREDACALEVIDPLTRGALFHEVQFELLTSLRELGALPVTPANLPRAYEIADCELEQVAARYREELAPAIERVWLDGIDAIRADLREWLRRAAEEGGRWRPERFELSFGLADRSQADPASVPEPIKLAGLKLRGSIDLIERAREGGLRVTDHKTGRVRAGKRLIIGGGKTLQPVLYGLAAQHILHEQVQAGRLYYCTAVGGYEERVVEFGTNGRMLLSESEVAELEEDVLAVWRQCNREGESEASLRRQAREWTIQNVLERRPAEIAERFTRVLEAALHDGFFPAAPDQDECRFCDYRPVCGPYEQERVKHKPAWRCKSLNLLRLIP